MNIMNKARGECAIIINNKQSKLCLTLGALAELETAFAANDLGELEVKLRKLSAKDFVIVLAILLKAGGNSMEIGDIKSAQIDTKEAAKAIAQTFALAFGE